MSDACDHVIDPIFKALFAGTVGANGHKDAEQHALDASGRGLGHRTPGA